METLKPIKVTIYSGTQSPKFNAYYDPTNKYWNGWLNPYMDKANRDKFIDWTCQSIIDESEYIMELKSIEPNENGLYYFGSSIVWEQV